MCVCRVSDSLGRLRRAPVHPRWVLGTSSTGRGDPRSSPYVRPLRSDQGGSRRSCSWKPGRGKGRGPYGSPPIRTSGRLPEGSGKYSARPEDPGRGSKGSIGPSRRGDGRRSGWRVPAGIVTGSMGSNPDSWWALRPPGGSGAEAEMALHVWASERMWNGLVGPDDFAWSSGASALKTGVAKSP